MSEEETIIEPSEPSEPIEQPIVYDEAKVNKYRLLSIKFIESNKKDLMRIYLQHSKSDGDGVLAINLNEVEDKSNVDVSYIPFTVLPIDLISKVNERKLENNENVIYFLLITPYEEKLIEIDIRTIS